MIDLAQLEIEVRGSYTSTLAPVDTFKKIGHRGDLLLLGDKGKSYLAQDPFFMFVAGSQVDDCQLRLHRELIHLAEDPLDLLENILERLPENSRMFGYFGYEATKYFEPKIKFKKKKYVDLPDICLALFQRVLEFTPQADGGYLVSETVFTHPDGIERVDLPELKDEDKSVNWSWVDPTGISGVLSDEQYLTGVDQVKDWIYEGECYQANFTQLLGAPFSGSSFQLFEKIFNENPSEYFCFWQLPEADILSFSPELFIKTDGQRLLASPIKGTIPRDQNKEVDSQNRQTLLDSEKDQSELNMIVDLFRNDFYRVCLPGTVDVVKHLSLMQLENVYHLYSDIEGEIPEQATSIDILRACFPSGSITGCPKIRSIELLAEVENYQRGPYTGSIGWLSKKEILLNVAIRTSLCKGQQSYFQVGGGIVFDSEPKSEYQECFAKAKTYVNAVKGLL